MPEESLCPIVHNDPLSVAISIAFIAFAAMVRILVGEEEYDKWVKEYEGKDENDKKAHVAYTYRTGGYCGRRTAES